MGFLVDDKAPVVWRGLMVMQAIEDLIRGVCWDPLDVLIVDMPPGTGDTQLSFAQTVNINGKTLSISSFPKLGKILRRRLILCISDGPIAGAVMVTTPQKVALQDALKGAEMFKKTSVPLLGFVLNMSSFLCPSCGESSPLVSTTHAEEVLGAYPDGGGILGKLPFGTEVSETSDRGTPIVISNPTSVHVSHFFQYLSLLMEIGIIQVWEFLSDLSFDCYRHENFVRLVSRWWVISKQQQPRLKKESLMMHSDPNCSILWGPLMFTELNRGATATHPHSSIHQILVGMGLKDGQVPWISCR